ITLGEHSGPLLFQLPPNMKKDAPRLRDFLALLPPRRAELEFRHVSWFDDEVFELLRAREAALCIADADGELEVPFVPTADWGYLRLRRPDYDGPALQSWVVRIQDSGRDWSEAFVFFKHEDEGRGPALAQDFLAAAREAG